MPDTALDAFADRYVAVWNEPDPGARRKAVERLWADDALQVLQPPQTMREAAEKVGMRDVVLEARGHDALEFRVRTAYEEFVAPGEAEFRVHGDVQRLHDVVRFSWAYVPRADGEPQGGGLQVLLLAADGRIATDYQFIGL
ncbi:hypothetical protein [Streptomyces sp. NRRL F-5123]|uniref:hypothetical protein n=1 Tax=Streptomyces sp. NRRL F-5123 TaxID=1463856 RepID=UPI0004E1CD01|nr:hypothetical protein [Streptomyces sp. NRRL F-5123]